MNCNTTHYRANSSSVLGEAAQQRLAHELYESVFKTIVPLPDFTEVFPGHGAGSLCGKAIGSRRSSTLGFERRFNVSMKPAAESAWTESLLRGMPKAPPYFARMKKVNRDGPPILGPELPGSRAISARGVRDAWFDKAIVLDTRMPESFAAAHVPGSISMPYSEQLANWAGWVMPPDKPIVLVLSDQNELRDVQVQLTRIGFDQIEGYLEGGVNGWRAAGYPVGQLRTLSADTLRAKLDSDDPPLVLDVRTSSEWESGHVEGARHLPFGEVESRAGELPREREIVVMCGAGNRSSIAASILMRVGFDHVASLEGGMGAWHATSAAPATVPAR